ncbi:uncharacterized protein LOC105692016 isoform X2 [Athalia rosae]|uniref:uncharacterized protein LOC105692016 isoform X2 n=1 Tax=Athalia rosae TaxID=37344 RepID=UPI002034158F|nr:uncharacterized protein LOC105692016 isoform X2 [Athalia rosae]
MVTTGMSFCYSGSPHGLDSLAYQLKSRDNDLRFLFHLDAPCGIITFIMSSFAALLIASALISIATVGRNEKISKRLQDDADQKLPRKESVLDIRPAYNCIHKHLKQTDVFQEKAKRTAPKSQWRKSRSPRVFCRNMEPVTA